MKKMIWVFVFCFSAATVFGAATVMVHTNTGVITSPTNFVLANGLATTGQVNQAAVALSNHIDSVTLAQSNHFNSVTLAQSNRINTVEAGIAIGSGGADLRATTNIIAITGTSTPVTVTGSYFETSHSTAYQASNGWFFWFSDDWGVALSTNVGGTNDLFWADPDFDNQLTPYNGATGTLTWAETTAAPAGQLGAGTNWASGTLQWRNQKIADGAGGLYIGNELWTNAFMLTNFSIITSVVTNETGGLVLTTGSVTAVTIK